MKSGWIVFGAASLSALLLPGCSTPPASDELLSSSPTDVSFYRVTLVCPAAPQIGCGSAAKPLLLELERKPGVAQAWLNRPGTLIAIIWEPASSARRRRNASRAAEGQELSGAAANQARADFASRPKNWYRAAAVDRLSEEVSLMPSSA